MKLHEAIRRGAMIRPQTRGAIYNGGRSCAIGAAYEGAGWNIVNPELNGWHRLNTMYKAIPEDLIRSICTLNDVFGKSREAIADWAEEKYPDIDLPTGPFLIPLEEVIEPATTEQAKVEVTV